MIEYICNDIHYVYKVIFPPRKTFFFFTLQIVIVSVENKTVQTKSVNLKGSKTKNLVQCCQYVHRHTNRAYNLICLQCIFIHTNKPHFVFFWWSVYPMGNTFAQWLGIKVCCDKSLMTMTKYLCCTSNAILQFTNRIYVPNCSLKCQTTCGFKII